VLNARKSKPRKSYPRNPVSAAQSYQRNRDAVLQRSKDAREARKKYLAELLGGACVDCGIEVGDEWPAACFDFHHQDRKSKEFPIARLLHSWTKRRTDIEAEIKKCVLLCSNCHRRRHFKGEDK
jgi:hypothetical protein